MAQAEQAGENLIAGGLQQMGQAETALMQRLPINNSCPVSGGRCSVPPFRTTTSPVSPDRIPGTVQMAEQYLGISTAGQGSGGATPLLPAPTAAVGGTPRPAQ